MREYEATPRPEIENHFHIRELIEGQEKRAADRSYHQERKKSLEERDKDIREAKGKEVKMFWCNHCEKDFVGEAVKQVEIDWSNTSQRIAFYRTKCFCGQWAMRLITDTHKDSYFFRSKKVAQDRFNATLDLLQPHQTNYELLYSKKRV